MLVAMESQEYDLGSPLFKYKGSEQLVGRVEPSLLVQGIGRWPTANSDLKGGFL